MTNAINAPTKEGQVQAYLAVTVVSQKQLQRIWKGRTIGTALRNLAGGIRKFPHQRWDRGLQTAANGRVRQQLVSGLSTYTQHRISAKTHLGGQGKATVLSDGFVAFWLSSLRGLNHSLPAVARALTAPSGLRPKSLSGKKSHDSRKLIQTPKQANTFFLTRQCSRQPATMKTAAVPTWSPFCLTGNCWKPVGHGKPAAQTNNLQMPSSTSFKGMLLGSSMQCECRCAVACATESSMAKGPSEMMSVPSNQKSCRLSAIKRVCSSI